MSNNRIFDIVWTKLAAIVYYHYLPINLTSAFFLLLFESMSPSNIDTIAHPSELMAACQARDKVPAVTVSVCRPPFKKYRIWQLLIFNFIFGIQKFYENQNFYEIFHLYWSISKKYYLSFSQGRKYYKILCLTLRVKIS